MRALASGCHSKLNLLWTEPLTFTDAEVAAVPRSLPGVYALAAFVASSPNVEVYYIGQSTSLRRRLGEHLDGQRTFARHLRGRLSPYFLFAPVFNPLVRMAAEAALIRDLMPVGNTYLPDAPAILVTPPPTALVDFQH